MARHKNFRRRSVTSGRQQRRKILRKAARHLQRVGEIAALWSMLEYEMDVLIWRMVAAEQQLVACVTSQVASASARMRIIKALADRYDARPELRDALNKFGGQVEAVQTERNRIIHDTWEVGNLTGTVSQRRAAIKGNKLLFGSFPVPLTELDKMSLNIRRLLVQLYKLEIRIVDEGELALLPNKPTGRFAYVEPWNIYRQRRAKRAKARQPPSPP